MKFFGGKNLIILILTSVAVGEAVMLNRLPVPDAGTQRAAERSTAAGLSASSSPADAAEVAKLKRENAQMSARLMEIADAMINEQPGPPLSANASDTAKRLSDLIAARKLAQTRVPPVMSRDGVLDPKFTEFYGLNADESARLQQVLTEASQAQKRLDVAHSSIRSVDADTLEVELDAYPAEGGVIHDRLTDEFKTVLGADRFAAFLQLSSAGMYGPFGDLGTRESKFTVRWDAQAKGYQVKEEYKLGTASGTTGGSFDTIAQLERFHSRLARVLTADKLPKAIERGP